MIDYASVGIANTRSMTRKRKNISTCDHDGSSSWSSLVDDLLLLIMMRVGIFDFIAFRGVCKSWRSVACSNWNKFMVSKQPMVLTISPHLNLTKTDFYLEDYTRRKLKTIPHSFGRVFVGLTCGYLIFYGQRTRDFWLVNPFTRKNLHFPGFPFAESTFSTGVKGILVFSPSMSGWVLVVSNIFSCEVSFSLAGAQAKWRHRKISEVYFIRNLHFFKGKIHIIDDENHLWELRLNPEPTLFRHKMKNFPKRYLRNMEFVSAVENLYVRDMIENVFVEVDFDEMKWVDSERTIGEYAVFVSKFFKCAAAIKPDTWTHPWTIYKGLNYPQSKEMATCFTADMWYYPHECLKDNDSDMEIGALLNVLEE